jgi:hypothetical protein
MMKKNPVGFVIENINNVNPDFRGPLFTPGMSNNITSRSNTQHAINLFVQVSDLSDAFLLSSRPMCRSNSLFFIEATHSRLSLSERKQHLHLSLND